MIETPKKDNIQKRAKQDEHQEDSEIWDGISLPSPKLSNYLEEIEEFVADTIRRENTKADKTKTKTPAKQKDKSSTSSVPTTPATIPSITTSLPTAPAPSTTDSASSTTKGNRAPVTF